MLLQRVQDACTLLTRIAQADKQLTTAQHAQARWPATVAMANGLHAWFSC